MANDDGRDALSLTDDEDNGDYENEQQLPQLAGTLSKWTNYIHGWQDRYIVLKNGTISYYKSEQEAAIGCRGAVSLSKAVISAHEFDDCRFDVGINDCLWYLRASNSEERQRWISMMEMHKAESRNAEGNGLRRHGSELSVRSNASLSTISNSSFKRGRGLREKLAEMDTFKDILCHQVDSLQNYFDACASAVTHHSVHDSLEPEPDINDTDLTHEPRLKNGMNNLNIHQVLFEATHHNSHEDLVNILQQHGAHAIDFKGEAYTFKATTAGIIATLGHCIELMTQREEAWKKRLDREVEKRRKIEENLKHLLKERMKPVLLGGPDYEEGPHSMLPEEEFFDAVDATLDKFDKDEEKKLKLRTDKVVMPKVPKTSLDKSHQLYDEINRVVDDHITNADMTASDVANSWTLIASEGDMKVYKREIEDTGAVVLHPLKAVHTVKGITGHELCHYFWDPAVRLEWEVTLDTSTVLSWLSHDTHITHQVLKRIWPTAQRDSVFWSTIRHCPSEDDDGPDYWIVVNYSTDTATAPSNTPKCVRIQFNVAMICQTVVQPPSSGQPITRDHLTCRIQYSANVNPGGWVPASVIQVICKREAPKFLKSFTSYVVEKTKDKDIMF